MNRGDWIQLSFLIIIFMVVVVIIYSLFHYPLWVSITEIIIALLIAWLISRRIKL